MGMTSLVLTYAENFLFPFHLADLSLFCSFLDYNSTG